MYIFFATLFYGMPSAARAWHTTFSAFLARKGCTTVGFERSMWTMEKDGHRIILAVHIDDFNLASSNLAFLEAFCDRLLDAFEGRAPNFEGAMANYLGCEIQRNRIASTCLSQRRGHYAEDVLRTFSAWNSIPALTVAPMRPNTRLRLSKDDCDLHPGPDRAVHDRSVTWPWAAAKATKIKTRRPDFAWAYSEISKFVQ